jgi:hypothetical protein
VFSGINNIIYIENKHCHKFCEKEFKQRTFRIYFDEKRAVEIEFERKRSWKKVFQFCGKIFVIFLKFFEEIAFPHLWHQRDYCFDFSSLIFVEKKSSSVHKGLYKGNTVAIRTTDISTDNFDETSDFKTFCEMWR